MDGSPGRDIGFTWRGVNILGVREKGISLNGEPINVTSDENDGWQRLLEVAAEDNVQIEISGVTKDETLETDWFARNRTQTVTITYQNGSTISGTFFMSAYTNTGPYNDATTFSATLMSSGEVTHTPASA